MMSWFLTLPLVMSATISYAYSTKGVQSLIERRMPFHAGSFELSLVDSFSNATGYDQYMVSSTCKGKIRVEGTTISALSSG